MKLADKDLTTETKLDAIALAHDLKEDGHTIDGIVPIYEDVVLADGKAYPMPAGYKVVVS